MRLLSRIEEIILLAIWRLQDNAYGITIREEVARTTGKTWLTGAIYASLSRMLNNGLVGLTKFLVLVCPQKYRQKYRK